MLIFGNWPRQVFTDIKPKPTMITQIFSTCGTSSIFIICHRQLSYLFPLQVTPDNTNWMTLVSKPYDDPTLADETHLEESRWNAYAISDEVNWPFDDQLWSTSQILQKNATRLSRTTLSYWFSDTSELVSITGNVVKDRNIHIYAAL